MIRVCIRSFHAVAFAGLVVGGVVTAAGQEAKRAEKSLAAQSGGDAKSAPQKPAGDLVPVELKLPKPAFKGTPKDVPPGTNLEPPRKGPRPAFMAPKGTTNVAAGKPVSASDRDPIIGSLKMITDGDKEATEGSYVELGPGLQWVQIDLGKPAAIHGLLVWHFHANARVYHDVIVQVSDDADFIKGVQTVYSNDHDNSSGIGLGEEKEYWETYEGRLIEAKGAKGRYVRLFSRGSTADDQNHYTEVEVYGVPAN